MFGAAHFFLNQGCHCFIHICLWVNVNNVASKSLWHRCQYQDTSQLQQSFAVRCNAHNLKRKTESNSTLSWSLQEPYLVWQSAEEDNAAAVLIIVSIVSTFLIFFSLPKKTPDCLGVSVIPKIPSDCWWNQTPAWDVSKLHSMRLVKVFQENITAKRHKSTKKQGRQKSTRVTNTNSSTHKQHYTKQKTIQHIYYCKGHSDPPNLRSGNQWKTARLRERERKRGRWKHSRWIKLRWDLIPGCDKNKTKSRFPHLFSTRFLLRQTKLRPAQLLAAPAWVTLCQWISLSLQSNMNTWTQT